MGWDGMDVATWLVGVRARGYTLLIRPRSNSFVI